MLVMVPSLLALMILSASIWVQAYDFITEVRSKTLSVTAALKATHISQNIALYRDFARAVSTRNNIQSFLNQFNEGNETQLLRNALQDELRDSLSGALDDTLLLQAVIYPRSSQQSGLRSAVVNATGESAMGAVLLPYDHTNGTPAYLGNPINGYPKRLYPNLTWTDDSDIGPQVLYGQRQLNYSSTLVLGPLYLDNRSALLSMTVAVNNNTSPRETLGWLTVVLDGRLFYDIMSETIGLDHSGEILIVGPPSTDNLFDPTVQPKVASGTADVPVRFVLPPDTSKNNTDRHGVRASDPDLPFSMDSYPAVVEAYSRQPGSHLSTRNENGSKVSVGYSRVMSNMVDWVIIFEEARSEAMGPVKGLGNTILACIFAVLGAILIVCWPLAHYATKPIRQLKVATENSIMTYEAEIPDTSSGSQSDPESLKQAEYASNCNISEKMAKWRKPKMQRRREFQIPEKVPEKPHIIYDELTDLTSTFNEMSDELRIQYMRLEDRVRKRTKELEKSRDLARAADESKTLFIANVSHELRTPLNGVIGMCSVAMQEDDVPRIKQSLNIIYKSSDLLLRLLTDLLTFSRNSFGQQLSIEHGVFRLGDIGTQLVSIFEKQAREKSIDLKVVFHGPSSRGSDETTEDCIKTGQDIEQVVHPSFELAQGPSGTGPLRTMTLIGDKNRILQVLMNLVSNSMKFTPENGTVEVRIRCKGFAAATSIAPTELDSASTAVGSGESDEKPTTPQPPPGRQMKFDFEVEDTGPGVPEHLQQEIFKPFVQGDPALTRKHGGTGLGLAICAQLATLMGGGMHIRSTVDIGSTFTFSVPLVYSKVRTPSLAASIGGDAQKTSIDASITEASQYRRPSRTLQKLAYEATQSPERKGSLSKQSVRSRISAVAGYRSRSRPSSRGTSPVKNPAKTELQPIQSIATPFNNLNDPPRYHQGDSPIETNKENQDPSTTNPIQLSGSTTKEDEAGSPITATLTNKSPLKLSPSSSSGQPCFKVLVAEDNKINQEVILRMLKLEKIENVTLAEDGLEAVSHVESCSSGSNNSEPSSPDAPPSFDLIFMDIQMPNMDGIEATKKIREMGFSRPIVALTAFDHEKNRDACGEAGMDDFVSKPLKRKALKEVLERWKRKEGEEGKEKG